MTLRGRLAALLVGLASSLAPAGIDPDRDPPRPANCTPEPTPEAAVEAPEENRTVASPAAGQDAAIRQFLETCANAFVPGGRHVRANVMTFTADRLRRSVNKATAFNMADDPDADLEIAATAGASGKAVLYRRAAVADLTLLQLIDTPPWGLTTLEQARVRPKLKSILSVPIFHPANAKGPLLGTLQVDSDLTVEEAGFNKPEAAELMQQFADVLSLLMLGVEVKLGEIDVAEVSPMSHSRVQNATQVEPGMYVANSSTSIFLIPRSRDIY